MQVLIFKQQDFSGFKLFRTVSLMYFASSMMIILAYLEKRAMDRAHEKGCSKRMFHYSDPDNKETEASEVFI